MVDISSNVNEIVKMKVSMNKKSLLEKVLVVLLSLHGEEKDLASYLFQRFLRVTPIPSIVLLESMWSFS